MRNTLLVLAVFTAIACNGDKVHPIQPAICPPTCPTIATAIPVVFAGGTINVEIAALKPQRDTGLMNRTSIAPDSGMIFVWATDRQYQVEGFHMVNTHFDLSVAFIDSQKRVINIEDMTAETSTVHLATAPYRYAIEARKGWFASHGVVAGAIATFTIPAGVIIDP